MAQSKIEWTEPANNGFWNAEAFGLLTCPDDVCREACFSFGMSSAEMLNQQRETY